MADVYDVVIVGGGAAGLSGAHRVRAMPPARTSVRHGTASKSGVASGALLAWSRRHAPKELLARGRPELERYTTVESRVDRVTK